MKKHFSLLSSVLILAACATVRSSESSSILNKKNLGNIYADAITSSYEYMFGPKGDFAINGSEVGEFNGGFKGLFLYSGMKEALKRNGVQQSQEYQPYMDFYDISIYSEWAGMQVFKDGAKEFDGKVDASNPVNNFNNYNPKLIDWAIDNLILKPTDKVGDKTAQEVYDNVLKRYFRLMKLSYDELEKLGRVKELDAYKKKILKNAEQPSWDDDCLSYLKERYAGNLVEYSQYAEYSDFTPGLAIGFWMRRHMDGTAPNFKKGIDKVLELYDKDWLTSI